MIGRSGACAPDRMNQWNERARCSISSVEGKQCPRDVERALPLVLVLVGHSQAQKSRALLQLTASLSCVGSIHEEHDGRGLPDVPMG